MKKIANVLAIGVLAGGAAQGALVVWDNGGGGNSWSVADNWDGATLPASGVDSVMLNATPDSGGSAYVTTDSNFVIASGQSLKANENGTEIRSHGGVITVSTGGALDLTNGGATTGSISRAFGRGAKYVFESGATARVTNYDVNRAITGGEQTTFIADASGAVTLFQVDASLEIANSALNLDLTSMTAGSELGIYELFDYGSIAGTFATLNVTGLEAGQAASVNYNYDFGGGDFGVAVEITAIPEPSSFALFGLGSTVLLLRRSKR